MVKKKTNDQAILEAKANIDLAKMMNALKNIKESTSWLDRYAIRDMKKGLVRATKFIDSMEQLKQIKDCAFNEAKIAEDIVEWIKSKAIYLEQIAEIKIAIWITEKENDELRKENRRLKDKLVKIISKFEIDEDEFDVSWLKQCLDAEAVPLKRIQEIAINEFKNRLPKHCSIEQDPFR